MKKNVILILAVLSCTVFSCTADAIPSNAKSSTDIGGQSGTVPPPPPPSKP